MAERTDRELLELAARAAGIPWRDGQPSRMGFAGWNPLTDDSDALRLAVRLRIDTMFGLSTQAGEAIVGTIFPLNEDFENVMERVGDDPCAAARRAIVRAAAEIAAATKGEGQ